MFKWFRDNSGYLFALALVGLFLYAFNLRNALFWDDADWILNNPSVHALTWDNIKFIFTHNVIAGIGGVSNYYRPFLFLTFLADYLVSGPAPVLYHVVSDALHIGNGFLIFYLLSRWLSGEGSRAKPGISVGSKRLAFLAALLFIIHPLQTEAVAYVNGRGDPLSVFLMLAAIAFFLNGKRWLSYASVALAILSKEPAAMFPAYLGVALMAFQYKEPFLGRLKKGIVAVLPFAGISAIYGVLRLTVLNFQNTLNFYHVQNFYSEHISVRLYTFLHALLIYFQIIFWPVGLHMERDLIVSLHIWEDWSWLGLLVMLALLGWLVVLYRRKDKMVFNVWFFGLGIFFINLIPTSGIVAINARMYEHWLYFSLFGFFTVAAWYLDRLWTWLEHYKKDLVPVLVITFTVYCLFLCAQSIRRNLLWGDTEAFYSNVLYYEPQNARVLNNLAMWYADHENSVDAAPLYERAIESDPTQPAPYYNLGNIAHNDGRIEEADQLYKKAIEIDPQFHYAYTNLAASYLLEKRYAEALPVLQELEKIYPSAGTESTIDILQKLLSGQISP